MYVNFALVSPRSKLNISFFCSCLLCEIMLMQYFLYTVSIICSSLAFPQYFLYTVSIICNSLAFHQYFLYTVSIICNSLPFHQYFVHGIISTNGSICTMCDHTLPYTPSALLACYQSNT